MYHIILGTFHIKRGYSHFDVDFLFIMDHRDAKSTDEKNHSSVVQTQTTKPDATEWDSHRHPNKIANHDNAERRKQVSSIVDQVIRDVMLLF